MTAFHLAFPVRDLDETRRFYGDVLGCRVGRSSDTWIDFEFFGHQISAHVVAPTEGAPTNAVDGDAVPIPHFGAILDWEAWETLAERLTQHEVVFEIGPRVRFQGEPGEQGTFFFKDPSGNALEFKTFRDMKSVYATT
jgi:uncharacterized protein